jgi:hypothetical protein
VPIALAGLAVALLVRRDRECSEREREIEALKMTCTYGRCATLGRRARMTRHPDRV